MGLDITAYAFATYRRQYSDEQVPGYSEAYLYAAYSPLGQFDGMTDGIYEVDGEFHFRAGSYTGYNEFLAHVAKSVGWTSPDECWAGDPLSKPLGRLINFGDNEGTFGPVTSRELAAEMRDHRPAFLEYVETVDADEREWLRQKYNLFLKAFQLASDSGAVMFH